MRKTTLKDVATKVGVSITLVSGVLNNRPVRVSPEKRDEIVRVAKELNYRPNQIARSLVSKTSKTFGVLLPSIESRTYTYYIKSLEELCREAGYGLLMICTDEQVFYDLKGMAQLVDRGVDGIFYVPSNDAYEYPALVQALEELPVPYVMVNRFLPNYLCDRVYFDNECGAYRATELLLHNGHTKIACVVDTIHSNTGRARLRGYMEALENASIRMRPEYLYESTYSMPGGYAAGKEILRTDVTAVLACSDYIMLGLRKAFEEAGRAVPEDYSLVSFDKSESDFLVSPPAVTVLQDAEELAYRSFDIMSRRLMGEKGDPIEIVLDVRMTPGSSVKPLKTA